MPKRNYFELEEHMEGIRPFIELMDKFSIPVPFEPFLQKNRNVEPCFSQKYDIDAKGCELIVCN